MIENCAQGIDVAGEVDFGFSEIMPLACSGVGFVRGRFALRSFPTFRRGAGTDRRGARGPPDLLRWDVIRRAECLASERKLCVRAKIFGETEIGDARLVVGR